MDVEIELAVRGPRLIIRADDQRETVTPSGLIAITHASPSVIGTVVAIGDRVRDIHAGDVVLFPPEAGQPMDVGGTHYLVLYEEEVLAVWNEEKEPI